MERYSLEQIPLAELARDNPFFVRNRTGASLDSSVREQGILIPLIVTADKPHKIISGHRRRAAAESAKLAAVPALVLKEPASPRDLFLLSLIANAGQEYLPMEQVLVVERAVHQYGFMPEEILKSVLPLLGIESNRKSLEDLTNAARLHPKLRDSFAEEKLPFRGWQRLLKFSAEDQETFAFDIASNLCLSASQLAQTGEWLRELTADKKLGLKDFLESSELTQILRNSSLTDRRQKTDAFMKRLRMLRYPRLAGREEQFEREARRIEKELSGVKIEAPANFEDQGIILKILIKDPAKLEEQLSRLQKNKTSINSLSKIVL